MKQQNKILFLVIVAVILALLNLVFVVRCYSQDSLKAKIIHVAEKTVVFKVGKQRFISFDCPCSSLKRGQEFMIPKKKFDSLIKEAKPIRRRYL